jgi:hypothetical protein
MRLVDTQEEFEPQRHKDHEERQGEDANDAKWPVAI